MPRVAEMSKYIKTFIHKALNRTITIEIIKNYETTHYSGGTVFSNLNKLHLYLINNFGNQKRLHNLVAHV